jgi:hypothetical protein
VRARPTIAALLFLALVFILGGYLARQHFGEGASVPDLSSDCAADGDSQVHLDSEQMGNAATVAAVGIRRNLPEQAIVVAIAAALQESKLRNLDDLGHRNDHDSLGLFQQRPSQGWGSPEQILDPRYATERFYSALVRVKGWERMRVTEAAQRVQRSAYPEAYQKWADEALVLTLALTGQQGGAIACDTAPGTAKAGAAAATAAVQRLKQDFGAKAPNITTKQHTILVPAKDAKTGWQLAHWMVANANRTGVTKVSYDNQQWSAERGSWEFAEPVSLQVIAEVLPAK